MMRRFLAIFVLSATFSMVTPFAMAEPQRDQGEVRKERKAGNVWPLWKIEKKILPGMSGKRYLGPEYDPTAKAYRLKFIGKGRLYYVDVDAQTGEIISRSQ